MSHVAFKFISAALIGAGCFFLFVAYQADKAVQPKSYEVVCVSGGMPVFQSPAEDAYFQGGIWVFQIKGVKYRMNFECAVRQAQ